MNEKLNELFTICGINDFVFHLQKEGETNYIDYTLNPKNIVVNIPDVEDKELEQLLTDKIKELKETFK
jgi:formiminotetrahydrofolate cyclodeaminase